MDKQSVTIELGEAGYLVLKGKKWVPSDLGLEPYARIANLLSRPPLYEYSPADGAYGFRIGKIVADKLQGKLLLPKLEESNEGVIY